MDENLVQPPISPVIQESPKKSTLLIVLVSVAILIGVLVAGYLWYQSKQILISVESKNQSVSTSAPIVINDKVEKNIGRTMDIYYSIPSYQLTFPGTDEWSAGFVESRDKSERSKNATFIAQASSTNRNLELIIMTNMKGEMSPRFSPPFASCMNDKEISYLGTKLVSEISSEPEDQDCRTFGKIHALRMVACVDENQKVSEPKTVKGYSELYFDCGENINLFSFDLLCEGDDFVGIKGREECATIFNQIMDSFKILNE
ncbi:MAG: hypothetical protein AAB446_02670 [Patescibacteria group bacterium]